MPALRSSSQQLLEYRTSPAHHGRSGALAVDIPGKMNTLAHATRMGQCVRVAHPDLDLSRERRSRVVDSIHTALEAAIGGSKFVLRGSLAAGTADLYSDIDAAWIVPGGRLQEAVDELTEALAGVGQLASARVDRSASSEGRCLVFVAFADLPVFWRFDLVIEYSSARSLTSDDIPEGYWSLAESALANAVAAIKAVARGRVADARGLLERGYYRVGATYEPGRSWRADIVQLARLAAHEEPSLSGHAAEVRRVAAALLPD